MTGDETRERVRGLLAGVLNVTAEGDPLDGRTLDSIGMIQLLAALEDAFGITIPPEEITPRSFASLDALSAMVERVRHS